VRLIRICNFLWDPVLLCFKFSAGSVDDGILRIGDQACPVYGPENGAEVTSSAAKIPNTLFYDNAQHLAVMRDMLQDYLLGEHLLLVGNQVRSSGFQDASSTLKSLFLV